MGEAEQAVVARLALTLARRRGDAAAAAAAAHVGGERPGGGRGALGVAQDRKRPGGHGANRRGHAEVLAAALGRPQAGFQGALPALQGLHQLLQLCLGARAPQGGPGHGAAVAVLNLHTVC